MGAGRPDGRSIGRECAGRRAVLGALAGGALASPRVRAASEADQDAWPALAARIFPNRVLENGSSLLVIEAPSRPDDAAVVPVTVHAAFAAGDARRIWKITLVIDANPSPVAATFTIGRESGVSRIATFVRVNSDSPLHAVAELSDGRMYAVARTVQAAGGCSAPALRLPADALPLGTLRFREVAVAGPSGGLGRREAQVMLRHPNASGLQMDPVSRRLIPADFLQWLRIWQGDALLLTVECGASIAENPAFRFDFQPNAATTFRVEGADSEGRQFSGSFQAATSI